jgi:hypothetical protein
MGVSFRAALPALQKLQLMAALQVGDKAALTQCHSFGAAQMQAAFLCCNFTAASIAFSAWGLWHSCSPSFLSGCNSLGNCLPLLLLYCCRT